MIGDIIYNLFITPLEMIFEVIFWCLKSTPALAIIAISIVMNFLALPLYKRADAINEEERQKVASMADRVARIKKAFKGDERYMVLSTYYREEHYKPIYALKSTFSLLLQIPFFIAAYNFLSDPDLLSGSSFLFLTDLGQPDQLLNFGSFSINLMPIIMTLINVISSYIYLKGATLRDKIQTYGIAVIFLVLLYNSPSGLVFYWTLNQVFSVLKNVFMKLVKKRSTMDICSSLAGVVIFALLIGFGFLNTPKKIALGIIILLICQMPAIISAYNKKNPGKMDSVKQIKTSYFILGGVFLSLFIGVVVPLSVISASPTEFATAATDPLVLIINNFCICAGYFIIWLGVFFYMSKSLVRNIFTYIVLLFSIVTVLNFMVFPGKYGVMSTYFVFNDLPVNSTSEILLNLACTAAAAVVLAVVLKFAKKIVPYLYGILIVGTAALIVMNSSATIKNINAYNSSKSLQESGSDNTGSVTSEAKDSDDTIVPVIPLSREGQNVVVLMLDRAISGYIPYIFNEKPELAEQYAGFTYYPNTVSFGGHTNFSAPSLFGGYEYTPYNVNQREDESLAQKHDEALKVMPTLFGEEGYKVTICDPPYAGYTDYWADISIYDGMKNVSARMTYGQYSSRLVRKFGGAIARKQKRNIFFYSIFRCVPELFRNTVYNDGNYYAVNTSDDFTCSDEFLYSYAVLYYLPNLTRIEEGDQGTLLLMDNDTAHSPSILKTPEYEPAENVSGDIYGDMSRFTLNGVTVKMESEDHIGHYDSNMAAYIKIGEWLDYLRENGVYDNTRILIVSDHGNGLGQFDNLITDNGWDIEWVNSVMLEKDFNSNAEFTSSDEFMTAADVPYLAMEGVIEDMTNPFTGNEITNDVNKEEQLVTSSHLWDIRKYNGNKFETSGSNWWRVKGNVLDTDCWEIADVEE